MEMIARTNRLMGKPKNKDTKCQKNCKKTQKHKLKRF